MGFRNAFEGRVGLELLGWMYEPCQFPYTIKKKYTPDFVYDNIYVECKGYFRAGDVAKYIAINEALRDQDLELVFVLYDPRKKVRKGSKLTMSEWCDKHGIKWFTEHNLQELKDYVNFK